jgi:hypothetical protein
MPDVPCSVFCGCDWGLAAAGGALDVALSAEGVGAVAGIVIVGFVAAVAGLDEDCGAAGGSRRTGLKGPIPEDGASDAAEGCAGVVASGSAARDSGIAHNRAAEMTSAMTAARCEPARRSRGSGGCGMATPVLGVGGLFA